MRTKQQCEFYIDGGQCPFDEAEFHFQDNLSMGDHDYRLIVYNLNESIKKNYPCGEYLNIDKKEAVILGKLINNHLDSVIQCVTVNFLIHSINKLTVTDKGEVILEGLCSSLEL